MLESEETLDYWTLATPADACREYARNVGSERPDCRWILTDYDTWESNPYYSGPPCLGSVGPDQDCSDEFLELHADCLGGRACKHGFGDPVFGPRYEPHLAGRTADVDDDLPF